MAKTSPLLVYRIGDGQFPLFDGRGAMLEGGRWNSPGHPVIYGGLSQSVAMLEMLANANIGKLPQHSKMIVIEIPANLKVETANLDSTPDWNHRNMEASQRYGDEWINSQRSVALIVPSVVANHDQNIVINHMHPDFPKIKASEPEPLIWDQRLFSNIQQK